ncbi:hypothetical protein RJ639_041354 [Escallonia herrerae]|uniref:Beta-amylase n=1 Tax=Escallonia herrerae TaxID=1293975 RepID=A0AA88WST2_9ASTE|nr:hypothetical protein RJ639_041354 [Escallonia herrerae]
MEYISLGCDILPVPHGRSPIQAYADFMRNFRDTFRSFLGGIITGGQVGMGPAGELRYPSCPFQKLGWAWRSRELGEFQCYDKSSSWNGTQGCCSSMGRGYAEKQKQFFEGFEMQDVEEQQMNPTSSPEGFLRQLLLAARICNIPLEGENSSTGLDDESFLQGKELSMYLRTLPPVPAYSIFQNDYGSYIYQMYES